MIIGVVIILIDPPVLFIFGGIIALVGFLIAALSVWLILNSEIERALFHSKELNWKWLKPI